MEKIMGNLRDFNDEEFDKTGLTVQHDLETVESDEYAELFAGLGETEGEKVLLYRIAPGSQKQGLLCRLEPGTSVEDIPPRFGGGDYIIKRLLGGRIMKSARLFIEGEPRIEQPKLDTSQSQAQHQAPQFDVGQLIAGMQESNKQLLAGLVQVLRPAENSKMDMLKEMAMYKELFAPQQPQQQFNPVDMMLKGAELVRDLAPRSPGESTGTDVLLEAIKSFAPMITQVVAQGTPPARPVPAKQAQLADATKSAQPQTAAQHSTEEGIDVFKHYLAMLVGFAKAGRDPMTYAEVVADQLSDEQILEIINNPNIMDDMIALNPEVATYRPWFETVLAELKLIMGLTEPDLQNTVVTSQTKPVTENVSIGIAASDENNKPASGNS